MNPVAKAHARWKECVHPVLSIPSAGGMLERSSP